MPTLARPFRSGVVFDIERDGRALGRDCLVFGRPPRGLDFQRQYARKPARCQLVTVSGLTIFKTSRTPGANRYNPANTRRSMLLKVSRCGDLRRSTLS
jgi:hypothetical protein